MLASTTVSVADPELPAPPLVEVTLPVVFTFDPTIVAVTATVATRLPLAAIVPPAKLSEALPAAGGKVGEPQPVVVALGVAATCRPAGKVSANATPFSAVPAFGLLLAKVRVLTPPTATKIGLGNSDSITCRRHARPRRHLDDHFRPIRPPFPVACRLPVAASERQRSVADGN
jgi:hypothetical protein